MKTFYPIQVIDSRFLVDYVTPKIIRPFEEYEIAPENTNLYVMLIKHRKIRMVSDGNSITGIEFIKMKILNLKDFMKKYNLRNDIMNESDLQRVYIYKK